VGVVLGAFTAVVTFATALINLLTARETRHSSSPAEKPRRKAEADLALPPRPDLVNRIADLRKAKGKLRAGSVVSIEGEVGVGKSATATELAYSLQERGGLGWRRRGQRSFIWIDCEDDCPTLTKLCGSLSVLTENRSLAAVAQEEKFDAIRAHLAENPTVLLLDNLKISRDKASGGLARLLNAVPRISVIIASVNSPGILSTPRVRLTDLTLSEARDLIQQEVSRLGLDVPDLRDKELVDEVLRLFGGNPYLITSFINGIDSSPHSVKARLEAARQGEGPEAMLADHLAAISPKARAILGACALLRGNAIASQLAVATQGSEEEVALVLAELMAAGLVTCVRLKGRPNMFTCGVGVRNVALAHTSREEIESFTAELARHYIARFSSEWENATGAISHVGTIAVVAEQLYAEGKSDALHDLFMAVLDILFTLGRFDERMAIATFAYQRAVSDENFQRAARASAARTMNCAIRGELARAREAAILGQAAAEEAGLPRELARQRRVRAYVAYRSREPQKALAFLVGADELAEAAGDTSILVDLQDLRAACYWYLGDMSQCEAAALEHQRLADSIPWERVKAYSPQMLAEVAMHRGDFTKASDLLKRSRAIATKYQDQRMQVRIAISEARLQLVGGRALEGIRVASEARALRRALRLAMLPPVRLYYARRRPQRLADAPIAGD
jgi:chloramphenicol 3-O-phosphotransferase